VTASAGRPAAAHSIADHEIRTTIPLTDIVSTVLRLADA
jgi:hypothetical protein